MSNDLKPVQGVIPSKEKKILLSLQEIWNSMFPINREILIGGNKASPIIKWQGTENPIVV